MAKSTSQCFFEPDSNGKPQMVSLMGKFDRASQVDAVLFLVNGFRERVVTAALASDRDFLLPTGAFGFEGAQDSLDRFVETRVKPAVPGVASITPFMVGVKTRQVMRGGKVAVLHVEKSGDPKLQAFIEEGLLKRDGLAIAYHQSLEACPGEPVTLELHGVQVRRTAKAEAQRPGRKEATGGKPRP